MEILGNYEIYCQTLTSMPLFLPGNHNMDPEPKLWIAVQANRLVEVKEILKSHPLLNVNWKNPEDHQRTALHISCYNDHREVVQLLLAHPDINVNPRDVYDHTPFSLICWAGHTGVEKLLLGDSRVDCTLPDSGNYSPLCRPSIFGHLEVVQWTFVSFLHNLSSQADFVVTTPPTLTRQQYVHFLDGKGLSSQSVSPEQGGFFCFSFISFYSSKKQPTSPSFLPSAKCKATLWAAFAANNLQDVKETLKGSPSLDVNWKNPNDQQGTLLHAACFYIRPEVACWLLAHPHIKLTAKTKGGSTPFSLVCWSGLVEVGKLLLKDPRVDLNEPDSENCTPLCRVCRTGSLELVRWMIASGRELDLDKKGKHPKSHGGG